MIEQRAATSSCEWISPRCDVVSELRKPLPNPGLIGWVASTDEQKLILSVLSIGELRIGITVLPDAKKRAALERWLVSDLLSRFIERILAFDFAVAEQWGRSKDERDSGRENFQLSTRSSRQRRSITACR